jgi:hypothetical protein
VVGIPRKSFDRKCSKFVVMVENVTFIPIVIKHLNTHHKKLGEYFQIYGEA